MKTDNIPEDRMDAYIDRIVNEFEMFKSRGLLDVLKTVIYIVDTFEKNDIVWGTGRGSSCASYILYILGLHEVDSVKYDLDIHEFFK
jgi:DNA polymerase-3 subunit alpha